MKEIRVQDLFLWGMSRAVLPIELFPTGPILNLGAGRKQLPFPTTNLDLPKWDARRDPIPYGDGTVGAIVAFHFLEHLDGETVVRVLLEAERVLKPGGSVLIVVPYYNSQVQAQNLDHKAVFCEDTFKSLFMDETYERAWGNKTWRLEVGFNMICGIVERNLCLMTQLIRI